MEVSMRTLAQTLALVVACVALNGFSNEETIDVIPTAPIAGTEEPKKGEENPALLFQQQEDEVPPATSGCGCGQKKPKV